MSFAEYIYAKHPKVIGKLEKEKRKDVIGKFLGEKKKKSGSQLAFAAYNFCGEKRIDVKLFELFFNGFIVWGLKYL